LQKKEFFAFPFRGFRGILTANKILEVPMNYTFSAPVTAAQRQRDTLLGALVGLARSTVNEPKTEDTDRVLAGRTECRRKRTAPDD
jgi:hypothetical protein